MVVMKLLMFSIWIANIVQSWLSERRSPPVLDTFRYSTSFRCETTNTQHLKLEDDFKRRHATNDLSEYLIRTYLKNALWL